jgi:DNA-binding CsgD family transcriptional regulator
MTDSETKGAAAAGVVDHLASGVLLFDSSLRTILINREARRIFGLRDGLILDLHRLKTSSRNVTTSLQRSIKSAAHGAGGQAGATRESAFAVPRPSGKPPFQVRIAPLDANRAATAPVVAVFMTDPDGLAVPPAETLRTLYGLNPTEGRVASGLAAGRTVAEISAELALSQDTTRWHVKRVFDKVGVRRQAQLVRVLLATTTLGLHC